MGEGPRENTVRPTERKCGREGPRERHEETQAQRGAEGTARDPRGHGCKRAGSHQQEGRTRSGGDSQGCERGTQERQQNRQGVGTTRISVTAGHPRGPRRSPQLGPGSGHRHPRSTDEAGGGPPPLSRGDQRRHEGEDEADRGGTETVAPHRGNDEGVNAFPVLVFVNPRRLLAQRGGSRLEGTQSGARNGPGPRGSGTTGEEAWGCADEREECAELGHHQRCPSREDTSQGAGGAPHEEPQGQEGKKDGWSGLTPVVHLGVAPLTERSVGRSVAVGKAVRDVTRRLIVLGVVSSHEAGVQGDARMTHAGLGCHDDSVPCQVKPAPQVKSVSEGAECGVESSDGLIGLGADEQARGSDTENVTRAVVLPLVDIVVTDALEASGARRCEDTQFEEARSIPAHLLDTDGADGLSDGGGLDQFAETLGLGGAVIVQDPPPVLRGESGFLGACAFDGVAQVTSATDAHEFGAPGNSIGREGSDVTSCDVDDGQRMRGHRLFFDGPQNGLGERRFSPCDEDRADGALCRAQPAIRRRRRLSRSDIPPQIPKRSSLASAYSRQSSRTWQA